MLIKISDRSDFVKTGVIVLAMYSCWRVRSSRIKFTRCMEFRNMALRTTSDKVRCTMLLLFFPLPPCVSQTESGLATNRPELAMNLMRCQVAPYSRVRVVASTAAYISAAAWAGSVGLQSALLWRTNRANVENPEW